MADQDNDNPGSTGEPTGSASERLAHLQTLEDGDAVKQQQMKWVDGANYGMLGADVGYGSYAAGSAAVATGATGAAAAGAAALATVPAVVALAGAWALSKLGVTEAIADGATKVGDALGLTIGRGDPHPACVGDDIAHSSGFFGMMAGLAAGIAIGAMVAATVATGGLAGALIIGVCMAGGLSLGSALASASQSMGSNCGKITSGSHNVTFEGKRAARVTDVTSCSKHSNSPEPLVEGSKTITINGLPLVRIGHSTHCSAKVNSGRKSIWADRTTGQYGPKNPELTAGEEFFAGLLGGLIGAKLGGMLGEALPKREPTKSAEVSGKKDDASTCKEDPVDVATGEMVDIRTDISIPGVLPLQLTRRYRTRSDDSGLLGPKWSTNWSQRLSFQGGHLVRFHNAGGQAITFIAPEAGLDGINLREPRYQLIGRRDEPRILDHETRQVLVFAPLVDGGTSRLERIEDLSGNAASFSYDGNGRLAGVAHTDGYRLEVIYHAAKREIDQVVLHDVSGNPQTLVEYGYDRSMLAHVASFQHGHFHYTYDRNGWMTGWRDTDQTDVRYLYDEAGRLIETGTRQGYHTGRFVYEDGRTRVIDGDGEWVYEYNADGLVTVETNPLGHTTVREWGLGRLLSQTDALGRRTEFHHDEVGNLIAVLEPTGSTTRFEYDDNRLMTAVVLPAGGRVKFEYDHLQRLTARSAPDGTIRRYRYGELGELLRVVNDDRETRFDYDAQLRLVATRLPTGAKFRTAFDVLGRLVEEVDPDGNASRYEYAAGTDNPRGAVSQVTQPDGAVVRARYNSEGLLVEQVDQLGRTTRREYGPFDLVTASVDAAGHVTRFEYDHATRLTRVVNALRETWEYRYNGAGRLVTEIDWGGRTTHYDRDAVGRLLVKTLPDGGQWRYGYDPSGRLVTVDAGDVRLGYTYDEAGRLATAEVQGESPHITRFAYDDNGRLIGEDQHGHLLKHVYDAQGRRSARITPHRETQYEYDALGALTKVGPMSILRDGRGRETGRQAGEFVMQRQYDALGRIRRQVAGPQSAFDEMQSDPVRALETLTRQVYSYDAVGQLERVDTDSDSVSYQHDVRGQVTSVCSLRQPPEHYSYDANLNIAAHGQRGPVDAHNYLPGGLPERVGYARYRYDARGRTIEKTVEQPGFRPKTWQFTWDGLNRLVKVCTPEKDTWIYRYDAFNRRVVKVNRTTREAVRYLWDGDTLAERWQVQKDGASAGVTSWHIDALTFAPLAQQTKEGFYPAFCDASGLPQAVFNDCGKPIWTAKHTVWGRTVRSGISTDDSDIVDTDLRFAGQWADTESGLCYNLNRFYDPDSGAYLCVDPIGLVGGFRTQSYVINPLRVVDPLGLAPCSTPDNEPDKGLSNRGVRPGPGERSLTQDQYRSLMSRYRNQGDHLQTELDQTIASQDYVYRATTWRAIDTYRTQGFISGRGGAGTYMSTDYVGTDPQVLMDKGQVFSQWGAPEALIKIPTSALTSATVPRPLGGALSVGWEPETSFYPAAGEGGQNQFMGTTSTFSDDWVTPVDGP
jgi:RHS repeat-associated protein